MSGKLRLYKDKLEGYKKFYSIVKTIKMVTLAKFRQASARTKTRDFTMRYTEKMFGQAWEEEAVVKGAKGTLLYIPITTNRGSCGALNSNMNRYLDTVLSPKTKFLTIGKKGMDSHSKLFPEQFLMGIQHEYKNPMHFNYATFIWETAKTVSDVERYQIVYSRYISAGVQRQAVYNIPSFEKFQESLADASSTENQKERYVFANAVNNNDEEFVRDFYDFHATLAVLNATLENELSEQAARLVAVEGQLTNISQLQLKTQSLYNKTRQGSITASLIEILSAMSSLEGNAAKGVKRNNFWEGAKM